MVFLRRLVDRRRKRRLSQLANTAGALRASLTAIPDSAARFALRVVSAPFIPRAAARWTLLLYRLVDDLSHGHLLFTCHDDRSTTDATAGVSDGLAEVIHLFVNNECSTHDTVLAPGQGDIGDNSL